FSALNSEYDLKLYGVEDLPLYLENLGAFYQSQPFKPEIKQYFAIIKDALDKLKPYIYDGNLKEFDALQEQSKNKKIPFRRYVTRLFDLMRENQLRTDEYPTFVKLQKVIQLEDKIDFEKASQAREKLIIDLTDSISDKKDMAELVDKSLEFKKGILSAAGYASFLKDIAFKQRLNMANYPAFSLYADYITEYEEVSNKSLLKEITYLEKALRERFYTDIRQKRLDELYRYLETMDKLVDFRMFNEDVSYFFRNRKEMSSDVFVTFIESQAQKFNLNIRLPAELSYIDVYLPAWPPFYELADKRDLAFIGNTLKYMDDESVNFAVLVTGGFHTDKVSQILKAQNVSYLVITPRAAAQEDNPYLNIMQGNSTLLEDFVQQLESTLAPFISAEELGSLNEAQRTRMQKLAETKDNTQLAGLVVATFAKIVKDYPQMPVAEARQQVKAMFAGSGLNIDTDFISECVDSVSKLGNQIVIDSGGAEALVFNPYARTGQMFTKLAGAELVEARRQINNMNALEQVVLPVLNNVVKNSVYNKIGEVLTRFLIQGAVLLKDMGIEPALMKQVERKEKLENRIIALDASFWVAKGELDSEGKMKAHLAAIISQEYLNQIAQGGKVQFMIMENDALKVTDKTGKQVNIDLKKLIQDLGYPINSFDIINAQTVSTVLGRPELVNPVSVKRVADIRFGEGKYLIHFISPDTQKSVLDTLKTENITYSLFSSQQKDLTQVRYGDAYIAEALKTMILGMEGDMTTDDRNALAGAILATINIDPRRLNLTKEDNVEQFLSTSLESTAITAKTINLERPVELILTMA
ncbi:MAG: hypothetical protein ABII75_09635, partial [Candidatus Omnitrophota bacterium]